MERIDLVIASLVGLATRVGLILLFFRVARHGSLAGCAHEFSRIQSITLSSLGGVDRLRFGFRVRDTCSALEAKRNRADPILIARGTAYCARGIDQFERPLTSGIGRGKAGPEIKPLA